jgi:hypothetical protein
MRLAALIESVENNKAVLKIYNTIKTGDNIEYIGMNMRTYENVKAVFYSFDGNILEKVNHNESVKAEFFDKTGKKIELEQFDILRMESSF